MVRVNILKPTGIDIVTSAETQDKLMLILVETHPLTSTQLLMLKSQIID